MIDIAQTHAAYLLLLAPLGIVGLWRWSIYLFKVRKARHYRPIRPRSTSPTAETSFVVPVYNEEPELFEQALHTWIRALPHEILLVIDKSDTACYQTALAVRSTTTARIRIMRTPRKGKREALVDGIRSIKTPFVVLIDSDTLFSDDVMPALLAPFADPRIGGVAPRQQVWKPKTIAQRVYHLQLEERYEVEMPFLDVGGLSTTCISGRTAAYRTEAIIDHLDKLEHEYFLGMRCVSGDDKCLTRIVQHTGWLVKYQDNALVWTHAAPGILTYLKQRLRWTRNTWRSDLTALIVERDWVYKNKYLALHVLDRFIQPFTLLLGPIFFVLALVTGFYLAAALFLLWIFTTRILKLSTHIGRHPRTLFIVPHYIVLTYAIALLKVFALFTLWKQGWITRWDKGRLAPASVLRILAEKVLPISATAATVVFLSYGVAGIYNATLLAAMSNTTYKPDTVTPAEARANATTLEEHIRNPDVYRPHEMRHGETLQLIAQRYNVVPGRIQTPNGVTPGSVVQIPIAALRVPNSVDELKERPTSSITYIPFLDTASTAQTRFIGTQNIVRLTGAGTAISIEEVLDWLVEQYGTRLASKEREGVWLLNTSIQVERDVTLFFSGDEVEWLKMHSNAEYYTWIASFDGTIHIEDTKLTSWNPKTDTYDTEYAQDGRSFLLAKGSGRLDILNATIGHLGYHRVAEYGRGYPFGGSYGLSWKNEDGYLDKKILTGNLINSEVHNNYFGVYTYGSTGSIMRGNEVHSSVEYGFDPHDDSTYLILEENHAHSNGNHGIITSKRCHHNIFVNNESNQNALHGIMLDQLSDKNVIRNNDLHNNEDGFVALDSHGNYVLDNAMFNNRNAGIRMNIMSSNNSVLSNTIHSNPKGVLVYEGASANLFTQNDLVDNEVAIQLRDARYNVFSNNTATDNDLPLRVLHGSMKNYVRFKE